MKFKEWDSIDKSVFVTARSCDFEEVAENQGVWDFEAGFLYQI